MKKTIKTLMLGAALCAFTAPAFAYTTSNGSTIVTSPSDYQTNQADYPHEDMGSIPATTTTTTTKATTVGTTSGSAPLNSVAAKRSADFNNANGAASSGAISNPQLIGSCLCMEQSYESLQGSVAAKQSAYDQAVSQRATLTNQLSSERANASAPGQVDTIRATSEQLIKLQNQINDQYIPQLQAATGQYNSAVGQYKQSCAGKVFDATVQAQVQSNLQCHG